MKKNILLQQSILDLSYFVVLLLLTSRKCSPTFRTKNDLLWARLFNISADGPNVNEAIWINLNEELQARSHKGLIEFISCTLHTVHNAFRKGVASHACGEVVEGLAFDLHAWFKISIFCTSVITLVC